MSGGGGGSGGGGSDKARSSVNRREAAARPRARGRHNTFRQQLAQLADGPKANVLLADHRSLDIRDGGNDPCDDDRR